MSQNSKLSNSVFEDKLILKDEQKSADHQTPHPNLHTPTHLPNLIGIDLISATIVRTFPKFSIAAKWTGLNVNKLKMMMASDRR